MLLTEASLRHRALQAKEVPYDKNVPIYYHPSETPYLT